MEKGSTGKILVFSSNSEFVISLCEMLSKTEYTFQGYHSWDDALEALKAKRFDVFLAEVEMPELDGIALLRAAMKINPHLIGIIITGQNEFNLSVEAMRIGAFDYITKPFKLELLLSKISRGIEVSHMRTAYDMYRTVFDNAVEGCYLMDGERKFVAVNSALAQLLGYASPDDLLWHISDVERQLYVDPAYHMVLNRLIMEKSTISDFESQVFRKDKSVIWISENIRAIYDRYGTIRFYRGSMTDITGKKQAVHALRENVVQFQYMIEKAERDKDALNEIIEEMCHSYAELEAFFINFVSAMVNVIDGKSPWMKGHSIRVASYATRIGKEIGLDNEELKKLRLAALLHDIGKIHCNGLLDKPEKLSQEEFEQIKKLPVQGTHILKKVRQLKDLIPIIRHHHERIDGKGYPDGLMGDDIPFISRILHVADSYDSMTANRPFRDAPGREYAFEELKRHNNTQFDSRVTDAALKVL
jgi:PAS domain S-box-containing protein/putative nucleotidyltransferase with HDIG domain